MKDVKKIAEEFMYLMEEVEKVETSNEFVFGTKKDGKVLYRCQYNKEAEMLKTIESMPREKAIEIFAKMYKDNDNDEIRLCALGKKKSDGSFNVSIEVKGSEEYLLFLLHEMIKRMKDIGISEELIAVTFAVALAGGDEE